MLLRQGVDTVKIHMRIIDRLQLVVPRPIFPTYTPNQREWLMDIKEFCEMVESRQKE